MRITLNLNLFGGVTLHVPASLALDSIPQWRRPTVEQSALAAGSRLAEALRTEDEYAEYIGSPRRSHEPH